MGHNVQDNITFSPQLRAEDPVANYWLRQVSLRLRREVCWAWYERGFLPENHSAVLPPFVDRASESLGYSRNWEKKKAFFVDDVTCRYLGEQIDAPPPDVDSLKRGAFGWVQDCLMLDETASFLLALGLAVSFDSAVGSVVAACLNDPAKTVPNLALAQLLWDRPEEVATIADPHHCLFRYGLLQTTEHESHIGTDWDSLVVVSPLIAPSLLFAGRALPAALFPVPIESDPEINIPEIRMLAARLKRKEGKFRIIPVLGRKGSPFQAVVATIAGQADRRAVEYRGEPETLRKTSYLQSLFCLCWLQGVDLFLPVQATKVLTGTRQDSENSLPILSSLPMALYLGIDRNDSLNSIPQNFLLPKIEVPGLSFEGRLAHWRKKLAPKIREGDIELAECSRRFRFEKGTIDKISEGLCEMQGPISSQELLQNCWSEVDVDLGGLAQKVIPRFRGERLILPSKQAKQIQEIIKAMQSLTEVHYNWKTADAWNEGGISVLFGGPPGTGKTMAAEVLADRLNLPMFRIDLSQVVNKYIGETEKNLKKVFDAADACDIVLFFDEADSLFGKRSEVKDAHDRYANLEISYLLERMERFKGLAILATNRKKDLDPAFLRRLRYIVDFPLPDVQQREEIWSQVIPRNIDSSAIDISFLARQFKLSGGHIRSIVFNACLQSAENTSCYQEGAQRCLSMKQIIIAVKREYDKLGRSISLESFGPYASIILQMESANDPLKN